MFRNVLIVFASLCWASFLVVNNNGQNAADNSPSRKGEPCNVVAEGSDTKEYRMCQQFTQKAIQCQFKFSNGDFLLSSDTDDDAVCTFNDETCCVFFETAVAEKDNELKDAVEKLPSTNEATEAERDKSCNKAVTVRGVLEYRVCSKVCALPEEGVCNMKFPNKKVAYSLQLEKEYACPEADQWCCVLENSSIPVFKKNKQLISLDKVMEKFDTLCPKSE